MTASNRVEEQLEKGALFSYAMKPSYFGSFKLGEGLLYCPMPQTGGTLRRAEQAALLPSMENVSLRMPYLSRVLQSTGQAGGGTRSGRLGKE